MSMNMPLKDDKDKEKGVSLQMIIHRFKCSIT